LETIQLTPEQVGVLCGNWYKAINTMDVEKSVTIKNELDLHIHKINSHKVKAFYELIRYRYDLFIENSKRVKKVNDWTPDDSITFYSLFFEAQDLFQKQYYSVALDVLKQAISKLNVIEDDSEQAEFYFFYGQCLYRLDHYSEAEKNINKAINLYGNEEIFSEKKKNCLIIIAAIASEQKEYLKAKSIYKDALVGTKVNSRTFGFINRAMALNESTVENFEQAVIHYEAALTSREFAKTTAGGKAKIELSNLLYYLGRSNAADLLDEGSEQIELSYDKEYSRRAEIIYYLYQDYNDSEVEKQVNALIKEGFSFSAGEVAKDIARFHTKRGNMALAMKYTQVSYNQKMEVTV